MNVASFLGDISHIAAVCLILGWMFYKRSSAGISGKLHVLYALIFTARYLDLFTVFISYYIVLMKIVLILASYLTVLLVYVVYKKTYEREYDAFWVETLIIVCLGLALLVCNDISLPEEVLWAFSRYLEAVAIVPQLYFTYKKEHKSNIITYYIIALILYRGFYFGNWIIRYNEEAFFDGYLVYPACLQFVLYFVYFLIPNAGNPSDILPSIVQQPVDISSVRTTPNMVRQESLLETPFLKRNAKSYSSVYLIGMDSKNASPNGSVKSLNISTKEERY